MVSTEHEPRVVILTSPKLQSVNVGPVRAETTRLSAKDTTSRHNAEPSKCLPFLTYVHSCHDGLPRTFRTSAKEGRDPKGPSVTDEGPTRPLIDPPGATTKNPNQ